MAEAIERTYHVGLAVASLERGTLFEDADLEEALRQSWEPGTTVTRYRRTWHITRIVSESQFALVGRIGFVSENSIETTTYDFAAQDFVRGAAPSGTVVPFAIRLTDGVIAYQLRPGLVRESSFTGALQAIWNAPARPYIWTVRQAIEARTWDDWKSEVDKVTGFNIRIDRPNPNYAHNRLIEDAVEGIRLEYLRLGGTALEVGVDTDSDLFKQAVSHVLREYGRAAIHGVDPHGEESTWVKVKGMVGSVTSRLRVTSVGGDPEIPEAELVSTLHNAPSVEAVADLQGLGDEREEE